MTAEFRLPDLGEGITEAEVVRWLVKPGDTVMQDQEVVEVQTDKAVVELPSPVAGTVLELNVVEGQVVPVETILLTIGGESHTSTPSTTTATVDKTEVVVDKEQSSSPSAISDNILPHLEIISANDTSPPHQDAHKQQQRRALATPVARRMARELGIDITLINGSGPAGRVRTEDVQKIAARTTTNGTSSTADVALDNHESREFSIPSESAQAVRPSSAPPVRAANPSLPGEAESAQDEERIPLCGLRRRIAENMVLSVSTIPQVASLVETDATALVALRKSVLPEAESHSIKLSYLPFIVKALVRALRLYPYVNAAIDNERKEIVLKHSYHIGIATATPDGLLVSVVRNADKLTVLEVATEVNRLAEAGRERKLQLHELRGSTCTITNYGTVGGFFTTPIINPGEAAILGLGRIVKRPWVVDDRVEVRPVLPLSFTADHRLIDGELAMRFLNTLVASLENPNLLMLDMR